VPKIMLRSLFAFFFFAGSRSAEVLGDEFSGPARDHWHFSVSTAFSRYSAVGPWDYDRRRTHSEFLLLRTSLFK
jgi:hypothetical protein